MIRSGPGNIESLKLNSELDQIIAWGCRWGAGGLALLPHGLIITVSGGCSHRVFVYLISVMG